MSGRTTVARLTLIVVSAALHAAAMPPWSVPGLAFVALVPLLAALHGASLAGGAAAGLLWGTAAMWGVGYWVPFGLAHYYQQPLWFGVLFSLAASVVFAGTYTALFGVAVSLLGERGEGATRAPIVAALWVAAEVARARLLTGDPWLLLGYALVPARSLSQVADVGGVYLLSFVVVLVNASFAEVVAQRQIPRRGAAAIGMAALSLLAIWLYGRMRLASDLPGEKLVPLAIVQGNNPVGAQWQPQFYGRGLETYISLSRQAAEHARGGLLVWPESAVTFFLAYEAGHRAAVAEMLHEVDADLILGSPHHDGSEIQPRYFNSAFSITRDGTIQGRYDKAHLLPFGEYFPLRTIDFLRRRFERVRYFTPGGAPALLTTRAAGDVAVVICFEAIFPELVRARMAQGARLLVNLSNDAWLGDGGAGPRQHLEMVRLRAIENRTWIARATTTGISAVIDPFGRIVAVTQSSAPAVLHGAIAPLAVTTLYERHGDVFAFTCVAVALGTIATCVTRRRGGIL